MIEQRCFYNDFDGKDIKARHLFAKQHNTLVAYARLFALDDYFEGFTSFGRVAVPAHIRQSGMGKTLLEKIITTMETLYPNQPCKISAQSYLRNFYQRAGFSPIGDDYLEDDIPHVLMVRESI